MSRIQREVEALEGNQGPCPSCDTLNPYTSLFCSGCGKKLPWADAVAGMVVNNTASAPHSTVVAPISTGKGSTQTVNKRNSKAEWGCVALLALGVGGIFLGAIINGGKLAQNTPAPAQKVSVPAPVSPARQTENLSARKAAVKQFADTLNNGGDGLLFSDYTIAGNSLTLTTAPQWDHMAYRDRLQRTQAFMAVWMKACDAKEASDVKFTLQDVSYNKVGGWNITNGTWVVER